MFWLHVGLNKKTSFTSFFFLFKFVYLENVKLYMWLAFVVCHARHYAKCFIFIILFNIHSNSLKLHTIIIPIFNSLFTLYWTSTIPCNLWKLFLQLGDLGCRAIKFSFKVCTIQFVNNRHEYKSFIRNPYFIALV